MLFMTKVGMMEVEMMKVEVEKMKVEVEKMKVELEVEVEVEVEKSGKWDIKIKRCQTKY